MARYRLFSYRADDGSARCGIGVAERGYDLQELERHFNLPPSGSTVLGVLERWRDAQKTLADLAYRVAAGENGGRGWPLAQTEFLPPVLYPNALYCAGANYLDHVAEMEKAFNLPHEPSPHATGSPPWHFIKAARQSLIGHGADVPLPAYSQQVDWEAEVGVVIGRIAKNVSDAEAMDYVAGYTIVNDLSARDHLKRAGARPGSPFEFDWIGQKNFDFSCPIGPWIVPAEDVPNPKSLSIRLWVNGELMQDSSTSFLIFDFADQVSELSKRLTLFPGDIIATGTPAGVGLPRGQFLVPGDRIRIEVEGIGTLENRMVRQR
jgi:2-keto-4-pentenoate hydratase/2-oxohepta-3-ene-1,7-dioic acid hydratase in catechol pathway